uniref:Glycosyltransferase N-terminal domain-containing protein n=1 Tax=Oryza nivara TaxID=4536 RepID=A0A0E0G1B0_ORYNI
MDASPLHVVVFPWLAFGHLLPALELAGRLASRGLRVSFVSTPRNIARLRRPCPSVEFVELPLPRVDGLPDGAEATTDVPDHMSSALWKAAFLDAAAAAGNKVDWLILDGMLSWAAASAADRKVPCVLMMPYTATAELLAVRSCVEFEPESVPLLSNIFGKPVVPIGLLPPPQVDGDGDGDGDTALMSSWLDRQPPKSVVYVALGSEAPLTAEQRRELALGLELSGAPFLWALRKPHGGDDDGGLLPPGFEERTRGRGMVKTGWVPQLKILAHAAVGAFLTHCGHSSVIEGLRFGHPLVMLPLFLDQFTNASYLEGARGVGVQVARDGEHGSAFDRDGVAAAVRAAVVDEESKKALAANAGKMGEVVADTECHERCIDAFIQQLRSYTTTRTGY